MNKKDRLAIWPIIRGMELLAAETRKAQGENQTTMSMTWKPMTLAEYGESLAEQLAELAATKA